jgi:NAD(P)-dependent dehydrogenase (short-subunit alcohol dehydrogenase family)
MGPIEDVGCQDFDRSVSVLLRGVFLGIKHALPVMKRQGSGSIINTASVAGIQGGLGPHVYSACKAAVMQLSTSVAVEVGPDGVRCNAICPGGIVTPIITDPLGGGEAAVTAVTQALDTAQPIRRAGQPEDIAEAALWLASDASSFVTAQALVVDGGLTAGRQPEDERLRDAVRGASEA